MAKFGRSTGVHDSKVEMSPGDQIQPDLSPKEKLIWSDFPRSSLRHALSSLPSALFGIPFFGIAVFWTYLASEPLRKGLDFESNVSNLIFPMFGIPFILIGAGLLLSPLWAAIKARYTVYAVTDQRLIIKQTFPTSRLRSWEINHINSLTRSGPAKGPGDLFFAEDISFDSENGRTVKKVGFLGIDFPKKLEDEIRKLHNII